MQSPGLAFAAQIKVWALEAFVSETSHWAFATVAGDAVVDFSADISGSVGRKSRLSNFGASLQLDVEAERFALLAPAHQCKD